MLKMVISGGQSGADLAGNLWARANQIPTVVRAFKEFKTFNAEDQKILESFARSDYEECDRAGDIVAKLRARTRLNVKSSDATLIFVQQPITGCRGSKLTQNICQMMNRPHIVINIKTVLPEMLLLQFMRRYTPGVLNVAGERRINKDAVVKILNDYWKLK